MTNSARALILLSVFTLGIAIVNCAVAQNSTFVRLDHVTDSKPLPNGIEIHSGAAVMVITALREDVVRVRVGAAGTLPEDASWAVLPESRKASVRVEPETAEHVVGFWTSQLHVRVSLATMALKITDNADHVIAEDLPGRPVEFHGDGFRVYRKSPLDEHYFGLGDKPGPLDRRNQAFADWNTDAYGWQESADPIYKSIPYFITMRKGVAAATFLDNTWRASFDFNKEYRDGYSFGSEGGPLDYYVIYGPTPKDVVEKWAWLVGKTPLPAMWTLGYQQCRYSYYPESEVRRIVARLRAEHYPADVIWLDIDYQKDNRPFTVDAERFPHFDQMIKDFAKDNFHTVIITDLHLASLPNQGYKPYDEGMASDHFVKAADGKVFVGPVWPGPAVFADYTQKAARDWWGTLYKDFAAKGVAGFWNDMNEPAVFETPTKTMPDDVRHRVDDAEFGFAPRVTSHLEAHNVFGMQNSRGTFDGLKRIDPESRPFVMTRASYAGGHRYAATWTGDNSSNWNHLRQTIPQLVNLGLSGFALAGADVGGFANSPQPELLTRWLELGAFQPIDRDHTTKGSNPQEPWENGTAHDLELRRKYTEERYRLMPYLYTTAEEMSRTGLPIMRPQFLEFPAGTDDNEPLDLANPGGFMFGSALLVAESPYPDEVDDYTVALPAGGWYNYWTGEKVAMHGGGQRIDNSPVGHDEVTLHSTREVLPVFTRGGAIVPEQSLVQSTNETPRGPLTLRVYLPNRGQPCEGSVYLDDGKTQAFTRGGYAREKFQCVATADGVKVIISPRDGSFKPWWSELNVEIYGVEKAASAMVGQKAVALRREAESHRVAATVADTGAGAELQVKY